MLENKQKKVFECNFFRKIMQVRVKFTTSLYCVKKSMQVKLSTRDFIQEKYFIYHKLLLGSLKIIKTEVQFGNFAFFVPIGNGLT